MRWCKCNEEDYPNINKKFILIRFKDNSSGYFQYYIYDDCPYGWNVLERKNAEFTTLRIA